MCKFTCKIFVINYAVMFISLFLIVLRNIACLFGNHPLLPPKIMKQCIENVYSSTIYRFAAMHKKIYYLWSEYARNIVFINNHWRFSQQQNMLIQFVCWFCCCLILKKYKMWKRIFFIIFIDNLWCCSRVIVRFLINWISIGW